MKLNISHIARLANLPLSDEEIQKFGKQLDETLAYIERLNEVDAKGVSPTAQVTGLENIFREDTITESFTQEEALKNTKSKYNGLFKVKAVFDE